MGKRSGSEAAALGWSGISLMSSAKPAKPTSADETELRLALRSAQTARAATMFWFYARMEEIKAPFVSDYEQGCAWKQHLDEVVYAGLDATYNQLKAEEEAAASEWGRTFGVVATRLPWLAGTLGYFGNDGEAGDLVGRILRSEYVDAVRAWFHDLHAAALSALRAELELWPRRIDPSGFAVGAMVWSDVAGAAGVFQITRRTHGGKRTFGVNKAGEVRLPVGRSGDGYLTGGSGYREVTAAWVARHSALTELWERELA